jgi:hypothetical protein
MEPASRMQVLRIPGCITDKFPKAKPVAIVDADFPEYRTDRAPKMQKFCMLPATERDKHISGKEDPPMF